MFKNQAVIINQENEVVFTGLQLNESYKRFITTERDSLRVINLDTVSTIRFDIFRVEDEKVIFTGSLEKAMELSEELNEFDRVSNCYKENSYIVKINY